MARLSPLQKKLKLKQKGPSAKQQNALAQADTEAVTLPQGKHIDVTVADFSHDGRGVGRWHGKTVFVSGALPGEQVQAEVLQDHKNFADAKVLEISNPSEFRQAPPCPHFAECGGCQLQHVQADQQVALKQAAIAQQLLRIAKIDVPNWQPPIVFAAHGYRRRAQLATRYFADSHTLLLGFRQAGHRHIVPVDSCMVLEPALDVLIGPLREAILSTDKPAIYGHVELLQADEQSLLVLQAQESLSTAAVKVWQAFAEQHKSAVEIRLADDQVQYFGGASGVCQYQLPAMGSSVDSTAVAQALDIEFSSRDFIQINAKANAAMVQQAMDWLQVTAGDKVLDLFCGAGNFSLPAASLGAEVMGIEGDAHMVQGASNNAQRNGLSATFKKADLFEPEARNVWRGETFNKLLMDPPRAGAKSIEKLLRKQKIEKLVYISCNPASMARDLQGLQKLGLKVVQAGCIDMFPHTPHLEV
ncbi:MAG TPA: 23S rRNA (uracil(1939)-C(5))-methyltransferase RlmD, partial [Oceanospirillaceae bacterium]|nr:23S rRNA (uracil(1939)-C(5))-methyltransferase RlmD [Oceanospirillaceae bacterium]